MDFLKLCSLYVCVCVYYNIYVRTSQRLIKKMGIETDKRVAPSIIFVYLLGLHNLRRHLCCRAILTKLIGVAVIAYQCL